MVGRESCTLSLRRRRLSALIKKEFLQIRRDLSTFLITIVLPLILMFLYGYGVSLDLDHLKVGLVLGDSSPLAQSLTHALMDNHYFDVTLARDLRELEGKIVSSDLRGIVVVPPYFSQYYYGTSQVAPIQVIADGSEANTANFVVNYTKQFFNNWSSQEPLTRETPIPSDAVHVEPRYWYNPELESRFFLIPGSLAIIMTLIGSLLTALVVAREWERGTMEALMSTPVSIYELMLGKLIPYFLLGMGSMMMCVAVSMTLYDLPLRGSWLLLAGVSAAYLICSLGLGLMISTLTKNQIFAYQITLVVAFLPAYILSGFLFEIHSMPLWIQYLTTIMPATYFVQALQTLFLVGNVPPLIIRDLLPILGIGAIFLTITARTTVKRLD